jgi:hypothetical protein
VILFIEAGLTEPPSETVPFRLLTMTSKDRLNFDNILFTSKESIDLYYRFLKPRGLFDYIDDILTFEELGSGLYISTEKQKWTTLVTSRIVFENYQGLVGRLAARLT